MLMPSLTRLLVNFRKIKVVSMRYFAVDILVKDNVWLVDIVKIVF